MNALSIYSLTQYSLIPTNIRYLSMPNNVLSMRERERMNKKNRNILSLIKLTREKERALISLFKKSTIMMHN